MVYGSHCVCGFMDVYYRVTDIVMFVFMYAGMFRLQYKDNVLREREREWVSGGIYDLNI